MHSNDAKSMLTSFASHAFDYVAVGKALQKFSTAPNPDLQVRGVAPNEIPVWLE